MEMMIKRGIVYLSILVCCMTYVSAAYNIDIIGLKTEEYNVGEDLTFTTIVLEDGIRKNVPVEVEIYDLQEKTFIQRSGESGNQIIVNLDTRYPSGLWTIYAKAGEDSIERTFTIHEKSSVEFGIEEDKLIIKNTGNIRYQKTVQISIGETKQSKTLNIPVGEQKEWTLIAPEGVYDIEVTDGETSFSKKNIQLYGTGNVIGAIDEGLIGYSGFGTTPVEDIEDSFISLDKLPIAIVFVLVVFGLGILIAIERVTRHR